MFAYTPLDPSKNEVRMLKTVASQEPHLSLVHCVLETVSLDDFTPAFKLFLEGSGQNECTPQLLKSWIDQTSNSKPESSAIPLELPYWRYAVDNDQPDATLNNWNSLMKSIDIDPEHPNIRATRSVVAETHPPKSQPHRSFEEKQFLFVPRFQWGDYEAISYCWESETRDQKIVLNGTLLDVPTNLEAMLQRLRTLPDARSGIKFWIDALCIDQSNVLERNQQVQIMQTIYSRAFSLVVWLGSKSDSSDKAIQFIASIAHHTIEHDHHGEKKYFEKSSPMTKGQGEQTAELTKSMPWKQLLSFLSRNYWHRLWIIQELALNHNMSLFLCGDKSLSRSMILRACMFCMRHAETIDTLVPFSDKILMDSSHYSYGSIWYTVYHVYCLLTLPDGETDEIQTDDILDLGRKANVKESIDKVYGILGLLPNAVAKPITPDYTRGRDEAYLDLAKAMLNAFQKLDSVFSWSSYIPNSTLPSWIPDWSTQYNRRHLYWLKKCQAAGSRVLRWSVSSSTRNLHCQGFVFDTVHGLSASLSEPLLPKTYPADSLHPIEPLKCQYGDSHTLSAALRRTLVLNLTFPGDELHSRTTLDVCWMPEDNGISPLMMERRKKIEAVEKSSCWHLFEQFRQLNVDFPIFGYTFQDFFPSIKDPDEKTVDTTPIQSPRLSRSPQVNHDIPKILDEKDALVMKRTALTLLGRRLITTSGGYLGTVPEAVVQGDRLAILYGCSYPVVLRPRSDEYLLIGECYLDGVMNGELMEAQDRGEFDEVEIRIC